MAMIGSPAARQSTDSTGRSCRGLVGTIACRDRRRKSHNGPPGGPRPVSFVLRVEVTSGHASASLAFAGSRF
jgi:hypothetical protein